MSTSDYIKVKFAEIRERAKLKGISEEEMRKSVYHDNPQYSNPDGGIERIIQRIYHPTSSDLEEELTDGL